MGQHPFSTQAKGGFEWGTLSPLKPSSLGQVLGWDLVGSVFGLPQDLDDVPALSVVDGLDGVDAAGDGLAGEGSGVGAPEVGDVAEGLGPDFDLVLGDDRIAIFRDGSDPVIDGENARSVGADGDEARFGKEELSHAAAVSIGGAGDGAV